MAAREIVFADPSLRYTRMLLGRLATNQQQSPDQAVGQSVSGYFALQDTSEHRPSQLSPVSVCWLVGWLLNVPATCECTSGTGLHNFTCCHAEIEVADPTFHLTQSQYTHTGQTSPRADPIPPGAWQGSHWSASFEVTGVTRPRKNPGASGIRTRDLPFSTKPLGQRGGFLSHW